MRCDSDHRRIEVRLGVEFINGDEPGVKLKRPPCYDGLRSHQLNAENDG